MPEAAGSATATSHALPVQPAKQAHCGGIVLPLQVPRPEQPSGQIAKRGLVMFHQVILLCLTLITSCSSPI